MGAIERRPRSATVRAVGEVTLRMLSRDAFLERIAADKDMALSALLRLSERLHAMDDRVASSAAERQAPRRVAGGAAGHPLRRFRGAGRGGSA